MPVGLRVSIAGTQALQRALERMAPAQNQRITHNALLRSALRVQESATTKQIIRGGGITKRGPERRADPKRLTSRTGALRRSIAVDRGPLPFAIEIGTDLVYGAAHELGSTKLNLRPRPFLQPALDDSSRFFEKDFETSWRKEIGA